MNYYKIVTEDEVITVIADDILEALTKISTSSSEIIAIFKNN